MHLEISVAAKTHLLNSTSINLASPVWVSGARIRNRVGTGHGKLDSNSEIDAEVAMRTDTRKFYTGVGAHPVMQVVLVIDIAPPRSIVAP